MRSGTGPSCDFLAGRRSSNSRKPPALGATFVDSGLFASSFSGLFSRFLQAESLGAGKLFKAPLQRFSGDMAALGKGEIFVPA